MYSILTLFIFLKLSYVYGKYYKNFLKGEMAEWLKAHAWKACKGVILSWVRIPFSPPSINPCISKRILDF